MPESKHPLKVFLCHAHSDQTAVRSLYNRLTKDGVDVWLDKENLLPGQDWELEISRAVREADVVVVCLSKQFNQAGFRQKEVKLALDTAMNQPEGEIFIIPARLEECETLESLRKWHWVNLFEDDGYQMLMRALRARANKIGATLQAKKNWLPVIVPHRVEVEAKRSLGLEPKDGENTEGIKVSRETTLTIGGNDNRGNEENAVDGKDTYQKSNHRDVQPAKFIKTIANLPIATPNYLKVMGVIGVIIGFIWFVSWITQKSFHPIPAVTSTTTLTATLTPKPPSPTSTFTLTASPVPTLTKISTPTPRVIGEDTFDKIALLGQIVPEGGWFTSADISPDGQIIAIGFNGTANPIQLWRVEDLTLLKTLDTKDQYITSVFFSPDGSMLASGASDGTLKIWMVKTGQQIQSLKDTSASIQQIRFSHDSRKLIASTSSRIEVWDIETGNLLNAVNMDANQSIQSFAVGLNDNIGYTTYQRYIVRYYYPWNPDTQKYSKTLEAEWGSKYTTNYGNIDNIEHLPQLPDVTFLKIFDFSHNGSMLLGMTWGRVSILNFTNKEAKSFDGYNYNFSQAVFSPDDKVAAMPIYSNISLLRINSGKIERITTPHKYSITNLAFSQNGWILITVSSDSLNIWGIPRWDSTPTPTTAPPTAVQ